MDLLVYDATENIALHVQAKAPLPPQGARLVQRLEQRLVEGISQLDSFSALPQADRDSIVSNATGRSVVDVEIVDVLLARSCFGTNFFREKAEHVKLLSLPVLAGAVSDCAQAQALSLRNLMMQCQVVKDQLLTLANPSWEDDVLTVGTLRLRIPLLRFDEAAVRQFRFHVWRENRSFGLA